MNLLAQLFLPCRVKLVAAIEDFMAAALTRLLEGVSAFGRCVTPCLQTNIASGRDILSVFLNSSEAPKLTFRGPVVPIFAASVA